MPQKTCQLASWEFSLLFKRVVLLRGKNVPKTEKGWCHILDSFGKLLCRLEQEAMMTGYAKAPMVPDIQHFCYQVFHE